MSSLQMHHHSVCLPCSGADNAEAMRTQMHFAQSYSALLPLTFRGCIHRYFRAKFVGSTLLISLLFYFIHQSIVVGAASSSLVLGPNMEDSEDFEDAPSDSTEHTPNNPISLISEYAMDDDRTPIEGFDPKNFLATTSHLSYNPLTDPYTWKPPISWLPPPWMPWVQQTWPSMTVGSYHLSKPIPLDWNTGMPLVGLDQVKRAYAALKDNEKKSGGKGMNIDSSPSPLGRLQNVMGTLSKRASRGLIRSILSRLGDLLSPSSISGGTVSTMFSQFLEVLAGPLSQSPQWGVLQGLFGNLVDLQMTDLIQMFFGESEEDGNDVSQGLSEMVLEKAHDFLEGMLSSIAPPDFVQEPDLQEFIKNLLGAGVSAASLLSERILSATEPGQLEWNMAKIVEFIVTNISDDGVLHQTSDGMATEKSSTGMRAQDDTDAPHAVPSFLRTSGFSSTTLRNLQALGPTYSDVYVRPGLRVGGSVVPAGRVGGWGFAYDMRGSQPGAVTSYGAYYPTSPYSNYAYQQSGMIPTYGYPYGGMGYGGMGYGGMGYGGYGNTGYAGQPTMNQMNYGSRQLGSLSNKLQPRNTATDKKPEDTYQGGAISNPSSPESVKMLLESRSGLPGVLAHLHVARQQWRQQGTVAGIAVSRLLGQIEKHIALTETDGGSVNIYQVARSLMDAVAENAELIKKPEWKALQQNIGGLFDVWGEWILRAIEPGKSGLEGMEKLFQGFLDSVGLEAGLLEDPNWSVLRANTISVLRQVIMAGVTSLRESLQSPMALSQILQTVALPILQDMHTRETPAFVRKLLVHKQLNDVSEPTSTESADVTTTSNELRRLRAPNTKL